MPSSARSGIAVGALLALILAFKVWLSVAFPVTGDEAYFIIWGVKPDFGYYDHPPMIGWLLAPLTRLSMSAVLLRAPVVLLPFLVSFAMYLALRSRDARKALYAALAFLLLPINVWNVFITTDTPLVLFSALSGLAWWKARERRSIGWHALAGALLGLAFLSKYFAVLWALVYLLDTVLSRRGQRPWRGLALTCATALPFALENLWWNFEHCWANILFNIYNRHEDAGFSLVSVLLFVVIVLYTLSPVALLQIARASWRQHWDDEGTRFLFLAAGVPFALFGALSFMHSIGLHWVLAFVPFFFMAAAVTLRAEQLKLSLVYLGAFSVLHVVAVAVAAALPLQTWQHSRLYDGLVFHFRIHEVMRALQPYEADFALAADGYSPAATASYYSGKYVFVFGTASSHARHDDLITDFRALKGRNILVFRKNAPETDEYRPYFRSVEVRALHLSGTTFYLVLGRGFDYEAYRDRVLVAVRERFYRIPRFLPQGGCVFCERYFGSYCPVRS